MPSHCRIESMRGTIMTVGNTVASPVERSTGYDAQVLLFDAPTKVAFDNILDLRWAVESHPAAGGYDADHAAYIRGLSAFVTLCTVTGTRDSWNSYFTGLKRVGIHNFPA